MLARIALGPWGAVKVVLVYLGLRGFLALVVGGVLNHTVPRFPLYLASALAVEGAAALVGTRSRLRFGVVAGALVGTVGLVGELAWVRLSGWAPVPMPPSMALKVLLLAPGGGGGGGGAGGGVGPGVRRSGRVVRPADRMPLAALVGAGVALVAVLAYPLPRNVGSVDAVIRTEVVGRPGVRGGRRSTRRTRPTDATGVRGDVVAGRGTGDAVLRRDRAGPVPVRAGRCR